MDKNEFGEEYSNFVKDILLQYSEKNIDSSDIDFDHLDVYGKYLEGNWFPVDCGNYDDAFELGLELGTLLKEIKVDLGK